LSSLDGVFTIGLNKINLLFDKTDFRPSCVVAVNRFVIEQNRDFFSTTDIPIFVSHVGRDLLPTRPNVAFLHSIFFPIFARDCSVSVPEIATVTYTAMQLAFHMGFRDVALVGCDHNFATKGQANKVVSSGKEDPNHFDPRYFSGGQKWQLPDLAMSELGYALARRDVAHFVPQHCGKLSLVVHQGHQLAGRVDIPARHSEGIVHRRIEQADCEAFAGIAKARLDRDVLSDLLDIGRLGT